MIKLASIDKCTACGACYAKCPKQCISMREDISGSIYPVIDEDNCIECLSCRKVCPILNPASLKAPMRAYAAWSKDDEERRTSASGGIAAEIYKYSIENGYKIVGASQNVDFSVTHKITDRSEDIQSFKNSKYVFSDAYNVFSDIKDLLKKNEKVTFIGLPCQVAALRTLFKDSPNLLLVDLVCHGTMPLTYLKQHIRHIENIHKEEAEIMSFRDPSPSTTGYYFTLSNKCGDKFYSKQVIDNDLYQVAYHCMIGYRENCYQCPFAQSNRGGDITLSDYKGLGRMADCSYDNKKVSAVLVQTEKGIRVIDEMISLNRIHADERPIAEPIKGDKQLQHPSEKSSSRLLFEEKLPACDYDFVKTMQIVLPYYLKQKKIEKVKKIPSKIVRKIKSLIK